jgi:DNA-binding NarL/FixJ family response regulator
MSLRVLIVDDSIHFLEAARELLEREGMAVVGTASTTAEALSLAKHLQPDVTLVDIDLGEESGLDLARQLTGPTVRELSPVILISAYPEHDLAELIAASPAIGFMPKARFSARAILELVGTSDGGDRPGGA